jgi:hypothetical protein
MADAYTSGTARVDFDGHRVDYRSLDGSAAALTAGYAAEGLESLEIVGNPPRGPRRWAVRPGNMR